MRAKLLRLVNFNFPEWSIPLAFLVALGLAFGLLLPSLGFFQDDWLFVYNHYALGPQGIRDFMYYDGTPFASYLNNLLFALLGYTPLYWQITSLLSRWLTVVIFWLILRRLWPHHPRQTFFSALVFALHPFFTLQPLAVTFTHVWISYFALGLSLYWMILSVQRPERIWFYTILSILAGAVNILSGEYFAGLEFLRPLLLWFALSERALPPRARLWSALRTWLPYLLAFGVYIYWRFFLYEVPLEKRNQPVLMETLLHNPLTGLWLILSNLIPDTVLIAFSSWYKLLEPDWLDLTVRVNQLALLLVCATGAVTFYYLTGQTFSARPSSAQVNWPLQASLLGVALLVLGLIPPYVGGLFLNAKNPLWNSRFGMASMLGAALLMVALLETLVTSPRARRLLLALFVGLAAGWHFRSAYNFRLAWRKEINFYRQLTLRIPQLTPGTSLVAEGEVLYLMGDYPTAYALNTLYAQPQATRPGQADYWFYGLTTNFGRNYEDFIEGMPLFTRHRSLVFKSSSTETLIFSFEPDQGQCLRVYRPQDASVPEAMLGSYLIGAIRISRPELIVPSAAPNAFLVGPLRFEAIQDWCYYYQKADLARQNQDWLAVAQTWREVQQAGLNSKEGFEYLPYLEASLQLRDFQTAQEISIHMAKLARGARPLVCNLWQARAQADPDDAELTLVYNQFKQKVECP